jgi:hypothetical protein
MYFMKAMEIERVVSAQGSNISQSRVVLKVGRIGVNLRNYAIVDNTFDENGDLSNIGEHFYQFPQGAVADANSFVQVFVGCGNNRPNGYFPNNDETKPKQYDFYWGRESAVWNNGDTARLLSIQIVDSKKV